MSSPRARRMARNHRRMQRPTRLNLVALMDIFTILVLFLMVNNGDVEVLQADPRLALPESHAEQRPEAALTIKVSPEHILVQGTVVATVAQALAQQDGLIDAVQAALQSHARAAEPLSEAQAERGREVVIMGDQGMPYQLLQRIMNSCAQQGYRDIALAVSRVDGPVPAAVASAAEVTRR